MSKGGRNLIILGVAAILIASVSTGVSLAIYHYSGDIYLDRSRPGFLPDEEEVGEENAHEGVYTFPATGALNGEVLDEYLEKLQIEVEAIDAYENPFGEEALSDEKLGI